MQAVVCRANWRNTVMATLAVVMLCVSVPLTASGTTPVRRSGGAYYLLDLSLTAPFDVASLESQGARIGDRRGAFLEVWLPDALKSRRKDLDTLLRPCQPWDVLPATTATDSFRTPSQIYAALDALAAAYPGFVVKETLGYSINGLPIVGVRFLAPQSDDTTSIRAPLRILGCHHGNEPMSAELALRVAERLAQEYAAGDKTVTYLLDRSSIFIVPMVNPDGRTALTRANARDVDLNRNYGVFWRGPYSSTGTAPYSEPEAEAIARDHFANHYSLSFSFHTYGDIINYVWNVANVATPDEEMLITLSRRYASITGYSVTNGYDWYKTNGDTNDFSYGVSGDFDWTIELADEDPDEVFNLNYPAILDLFNMTITGSVQIAVRDAATDAPTPSLLRFVQEGDAATTTASWVGYAAANGYFFRLLSEGSYLASAYHPDYAPSSINFYRNPFDPMFQTGPLWMYRRDVPVVCAYRVIEIIEGDYRAASTLNEALGEPDGVAVKLPAETALVLELAADCYDGPGDDLTLTLGADTTFPPGVAASAGDDLLGEETLVSVGAHGGIDFDGALIKARFVRIMTPIDCDGSCVSLDAVMCRYPTPPSSSLDGDAETDMEPSAERDDFSDDDSSREEVADDDMSDGDTKSSPDDEQERSKNDEMHDYFEDSHSDTASITIDDGCRGFSRVRLCALAILGLAGSMLLRRMRRVSLPPKEGRQ